MPCILKLRQKKTTMVNEFSKKGQRIQICIKQRG